MATDSKDGDKDQQGPKIEPDTDVVELVAHLEDPEQDPTVTLAAIQKRLAAWTMGRKGGDGTAILRVKRVSPPEMRLDCGDLPVDLHTPFDWSQIPVTWGAEGVYYLRLYWGSKRISNLGVIEFPEWRTRNILEPPTQTAPQPQQTIPIQVRGSEQQILLQLVTVLTNQQHSTNQAVAEALEANTKAILALAEGKQNQAETKPAGIFEDLDKFSEIAGQLKKFQKMIGGLGGEGSPDESPWVGLVREIVDEYAEDTIAGTFQLIHSFKKDDGDGDGKKTTEVEGTIIELPKKSEGQRE